MPFSVHNTGSSASRHEGSGRVRVKRARAMATGRKRQEPTRPSKIRKKLFQAISSNHRSSIRNTASTTASTTITIGSTILPFLCSTACSKSRDFLTWMAKHILPKREGPEQKAAAATEASVREANVLVRESVRRIVDFEAACKNDRLAAEAAAAAAETAARDRADKVMADKMMAERADKKERTRRAAANARARLVFKREEEARRAAIEAQINMLVAR
ncbi:unnamed protein product, partial [Scytosiphon promiscuus]